MRRLFARRPRGIVVGPLTDADAIALHRAVEQLRRSPARIAPLAPAQRAFPTLLTNPLGIVAMLATSAATGAGIAFAAIHLGYL